MTTTVESVHGDAKIDVVLLLIKKATDDNPSGIPGKKALQKSMYFFSEYFDMFFFKWFDYGPMSEELQQIVADLVYEGRVTVTPTPTKRPDIYTQYMAFNHSSVLAEFFYEKEFSDEINQKMGRNNQTCLLYTSDAADE